MVGPMSGSASRRRPPPELRAREDRRPEPPARAGDLFAHFGVAVGADRGEPAAVVDGRACVGCGWLLPAASQRPCPLCGREGEAPVE